METNVPLSFCHLHQRIGSSLCDPTVPPHAGESLSSPPLFYFLSSTKVDDNNFSLLLFHNPTSELWQRALMKRNMCNPMRSLSQLWSITTPTTVTNRPIENLKSFINFNGDNFHLTLVGKILVPLELNWFDIFFSF